MVKNNWLVLVIVGVALSGCAGVSFDTEGTDKSKHNGIRYYEPRPFILVYTDSKGGLSSELIWLPDTRRVRTIRPYAVAAKNDATFTFSNGVMTQAKSVVDQTVIPKAIIGALKSTAVTAAAAALNDAKDDEHQLPAPILFAIDFDAAGAWTITQSTTTQDKVSLILVKQPKEDK